MNKMEILKMISFTIVISGIIISCMYVVYNMIKFIIKIWRT